MVALFRASGGCAASPEVLAGPKLLLCEACCTPREGSQIARQTPCWSFCNILQLLQGWPHCCWGPPPRA